MPRTRAARIYRIKVTLAEVAPPVWRRLLVPADMSLAKLHDALQAAMSWTNSHLHCFEIAGRRIGMVGVEEGSPEFEDERRVRVSSVLPKKGAFPIVASRIRCASQALAHVLPRTAGVFSATTSSSRLSRPRSTTSMTRCSPGLAGTSIRTRSTRTR